VALRIHDHFSSTVQLWPSEVWDVTVTPPVAARQYVNNICSGRFSGLRPPMGFTFEMSSWVLLYTTQDFLRGRDLGFGQKNRGVY